MRARNTDIDIALTALCQHQQPGQTMTAIALAEVCGCHVSYIQCTERRALDKLRKLAASHPIKDFVNPDL